MGGKGHTQNLNCTWGALGVRNVTSWVVAVVHRALEPGFVNEILLMSALNSILC